jgi:sodium/potassium-transporting ATPase subunit alpha
MRQERDGPNKMPEKKRMPGIVKFLLEISNLFSILLWIAAILSFVGFALAPNDYSNLYLAITLIIVILISGLCSFLQYKSSETILESFKTMNIAHASVIRDKRQVKVNVTELVKGDVIKIKMGEKIPADIRVFTSNLLKVDNSPLTGESLPVKIGIEPGEKGLNDPMEALNVVYYSTLCKEGEGLGVIIAIGKDTFMGRIADLASSSEATMTTLQIEINKFIKLIAILAISIGIVFFALGFAINYPVVTNFIFAIGIVVANVPEGLGYSVTTILAITAKKMYTRKVFIKNLQSVETLGSITCICSDKTGTLTQNKMTVVHLWYDLEIKNTRPDQEILTIDNKNVEGGQFNPENSSFEFVKFVGVCGSKGKFLKDPPEDYPPLIAMKKAWEKTQGNEIHPQDAIDAVNKMKEQLRPEYMKYYDTNIDERMTDTDASETGIIKFFEKVEPIDVTRARYPQHLYKDEAICIPFNSKLKFACFLRVRQVGDHALLSLAFKGAPEQLIKRCNRYLINGKELPVDESFQKEFNNANKAFALKGERVIGLAYTNLDPAKYTLDYPYTTKAADKEDPEPNFPIEGLCFVGLIAMEDPPRPGVKEAIRTCNDAGIKVIMVTGDQTLTAASIAYQIGIIKNLDDAPEIIKDREGLKTIEEAEKKSNTIIISGERLHRVMKAEEDLSEDNPRKGATLRSWLMKRDVVFARTSPEQKLIIVDGCQKLSHCVAVTGDGVNDSPAIKKADIGIAMGKGGTEVAKDAADILLLDDNFANIVKGIKRGRLVFDILKKIIRYNLCSNFSELIPFLGFVILQFPLPVFTIYILIIDVGTNIYPNICFAYEIPEQNIMKRRPRNVKTDRLCTLQLLGYSYIYVGVIQTAACFLSYFVIFNDYGFKPFNLFFFSTRNGIEPGPNDIYNIYDPLFKGNSNAFLAANAHLLGINGNSRDIYINNKLMTYDYQTEEHLKIDLRLFFFYLPDTFWGTCSHDSIGYDFDESVCWRGEAIRHAQTGYLVAFVLMQVINGLSSRTKIASIFKHRIHKNIPINTAYLVEVAIICLIVYAPGLNLAFLCRPILFIHWVPPMLMFIMYFFYEELTKLLIRTIKNPDGSPGFFYKAYNY